MYRRTGRGDLRCPCLANTAACGSAHGSALQQWVFVQKCLLERKRSYLTEKGLFLLKAPSSSESMQTHSALVFLIRISRSGATWRSPHCGQALVRHPDEGVHLAKFPGKLAPGIARIGAAKDLTVDATGQQKIGVGSVRSQVPDRAVGG